MAENKNGLQFAWFTGHPKGSFYAHSTDNGQTFSPRNAISNAGSHPQLTTKNDGSILITWDEDLAKGFRRIGLQKRSATGDIESSRFITADTVTASYPVLTREVLVYTKKVAGKNYLRYQLLH